MRNDVIIATRQLSDVTIKPIENHARNRQRISKCVSSQTADIKMLRSPERLYEQHLMIDDLPDDALLRIFHFLTKQELLQASLVCATWRRVARDGALWSSLDLSQYACGLDDETLAGLLMLYFVPMGKHLCLKGKKLQWRSECRLYYQAWSIKGQVSQYFRCQISRCI